MAFRRRKLKPDKWEACLAKIAADGDMSKRDALNLLQEVADRGENMRQTGTADPFVAAAKALAAQIKEGARADALDAARNAATRKQVVGLVEQYGGIAKAAEVLRGELHGSNITGRDSVQGRWRGIGARWWGLANGRATQQGVDKVAISGADDLNFARGLWDRKAGVQKAPANTPGEKLAAIAAPLLEDARVRLNNAGARIADATDYVAKTTHDPVKMRKAAGPRKSPEEAFQEWWRLEQPLWAEKTFKDVTPEENETVDEARERFARSIFFSRVTGVRKKAAPALGLEDEDTFVPVQFQGTRNIARKLSQPRVIYWKGPEEWLTHMQRFGKGRTVWENVLHTLDTSARQLALMEKFGTNPEANLNQITDTIAQKYRDEDPDGVTKFQNKVPGIQRVMDQLTGKANVPYSQMGAKIGATIRTAEVLGYGGGFGLTHFASIWPTVMSEARQHGVGGLQMIGNLISGLAKGVAEAVGGRSDERAEMLAQMGSYAHGLTREMYSKWQPEDNVPGRLSTIANVFMKYTTLPWLFDTAQSAFKETLANQLARYTGKAFGDLDPHLSQMLGKYGIGQSEWDLLRAVPDLIQSDGMHYMTPDTALRIDADDAETLLRARGAIGDKAKPDAIAKAVEDLQYDLADRLASYYEDSAAHSTVTAGAKERAMVYGSAGPGSVTGELMRFVMQFKMWPLAAMTQIVGRDIWMSLSRKEAAWNIGTMATLAATFGYVRMSVNDMATGRPLRDPRDPNTLLAALAQGGGIGLVGDFLFGEVNRFEGGWLPVAGGPVASDADQLAKIYQRWKNPRPAGAKPYDAWPDLAHFAVRHVPFANLVYLKGILDYMVWYHLYEAVSPGWWERTNRRLIREQGRGMTGYTPGGRVPWTPWGLSLGSPSAARTSGSVQQPTIQ